MHTNAGREALEGCDCTELCAMGPTCPGGILARLPDSGCWRTAPTRDDLTPIRVGDLPPWTCCGKQGDHALWCPWHPENAQD